GVWSTASVFGGASRPGRDPERPKLRALGPLPHLPQQLGEPVADAVAEPPLGHAFAHVRHRFPSAIAQRNEAGDVALDGELLALLGLDARRDRLVVEAVGLVLGLDRGGHAPPRLNAPPERAR